MFNLFILKNNGEMRHEVGKPGKDRRQGEKNYLDLIAWEWGR